MPVIKFLGPIRHRITSFLAINQIALKVYFRRIFGRRVEPTWGVNMEIGIRFSRRQFSRAMLAADIKQGRLILDSLQTETPDVYEVVCTEQASPKGVWFMPRQQKTGATVLYFHGGGYAFYGAMSIRFGKMLAHHIGAPVFAADYRLTPEHVHPAQAEDALAAWDYVTKDVVPKDIVVIGDSAGGHMMLTLLRDLKKRDSEQPALGIGLCPWTDIGARGESLSGNDTYDLVQGWMAVQFGQWLDPEGHFGRRELSPISYDYSGLAPLYLQAGGHEILHDMIYDFAQIQVDFGADVMLDVWPAMPHDFQLMDSLEVAATEALSRIKMAVRFAVGEVSEFKGAEMTVIAGGSIMPLE